MGYLRVHLVLFFFFCFFFFYIRDLSEISRGRGGGEMGEGHNFLSS